MAWYDSLYNAASSVGRGVMNNAPAIGGAIGSAYGGPAGGILGAQLGAGVGSQFNPQNTAALRDQASDLSQYQLWKLNMDPRFGSYLPSNRMPAQEMRPQLPQGMNKTDNPPTGSIWDRFSGGAQGVARGAYDGGPEQNDRLKREAQARAPLHEETPTDMGDNYRAPQDYRAPSMAGIYGRQQAQIEEGYSPSQGMYKTDNPPTGSIWDRFSRGAYNAGARGARGVYDGVNSLGRGAYNAGARGARGLGDILSNMRARGPKIPEAVFDDAPYRRYALDLERERELELYGIPTGGNPGGSSMASIYGRENLPSEAFTEGYSPASHFRPPSNFFSRFNMPSAIDSDLNHSSLASLYGHKNSGHYADGGMVTGPENLDGASMEDLLRSLTPQQLAQLAVASGQGMGRNLLQ